MRGFGYTPVDPGMHSLQEQRALFRGATHIVGTSGAGFANYVYCRQGTKVMEIFSARNFDPFHWSVADPAGLEYHCILSSPDDELLVGRGTDQDFQVDIANLVRNLENYGFTG